MLQALSNFLLLLFSSSIENPLYRAVSLASIYIYIDAFMKWTGMHYCDDFTLCYRGWNYASFVAGIVASVRQYNEFQPIMDNLQQLFSLESNSFWTSFVSLRPKFN